MTINVAFACKIWRHWLCLLAVLSACAGTGCETKTTGPGHVPSAVTKAVNEPRRIDLNGIDLRDIAKAGGLDFVWPEQIRPMRTPEAFGCGCAAFDFDNDGWQDVLLVADPCCRLFRNLGDGRFVDVTESLGLHEIAAQNWIGCAVGDYDGDGWLDLLLTGFHRLALCRNDAGKKFADVTIAAGLDSDNHNHWGASAGFMDLNGDQWLDLVIINYVEFGPDSKQYCVSAEGVKTSCPPTHYVPEQGEIWCNAQGRRFDMVPPEQGMRDTSGVGLVLAFVDLDDDRRMDFYVGNDGKRADLMHNLGEMRFANIAVEAGVAFDRKLAALAAMGADWGDYDRDGKLDLTVSNFQSLSFVLFRQFDVKSFLDVSTSVGIAQATHHRLGFGLNWIDFDNDGWPDIAYVNGHVYENVEETGVAAATYRQPLMLMRNANGKKFEDLTPGLSPEVGRPMVGRGSATLDFDNDGKLDFLVVDYEGPVMLLHNRSQTKNHWAMFDLRSAGPNRFAYGAQIVARSGPLIWKAQVSPSASYLSTEDPRVHLGLGPVQRLDTVTIRWPSGTEQVLRDIDADQIHRIEEPSSPLAPTSR